jgi:hypothetical protein
MNDEKQLLEEVAEKERELQILDGELQRLEAGGRFDRPHVVVALSLLLLLFACAARSWMARAEPPPTARCEGR